MESRGATGMPHSVSSFVFATELDRRCDWRYRRHRSRVHCVGAHRGGASVLDALLPHVLDA